MSRFSEKLLFEILIALGIIAVLSGGVLFFGSSVSGASESILKSRKELSDWAASVQTYALVSSQYTTKARGYMNVLETVLPEKDKLIDLRKEFQFLGSEEGVSVNLGFSGERETDSAAVGSVGFTLNLGAEQMQPMVNFVKKLENFQYLVVIDSVSISEKDSDFVGLVRGRVLYRN